LSRLDNTEAAIDRESIRAGGEGRNDLFSGNLSLADYILSSCRVMYLRFLVSAIRRAAAKSRQIRISIEQMPRYSSILFLRDFLRGGKGIRLFCFYPYDSNCDSFDILIFDFRSNVVLMDVEVTRRYWRNISRSSAFKHSRLDRIHEEFTSLYRQGLIYSRLPLSIETLARNMDTGIIEICRKFSLSRTKISFASTSTSLYTFPSASFDNTIES